MLNEPSYCVDFKDFDGLLLFVIESEKGSILVEVYDGLVLVQLHLVHLLEGRVLSDKHAKDQAIGEV